eukprot:CAMPEP_0185736350 /NCGR_PEP_ID=MMETSP1171-20130828/27601_1 /TAXON_ID=374046 /ORGANISM="Helicotheca tamensis, Strain CCMP826" /LENGTH=96 /DNA_ID=CAMNT_0028406923 /DNA_START=203 /DNA_END=493 /DNA_ORIENTATION=-
MYFTVLYFHYFLGVLFFTFLFFGLLRNVIWKTANVGNKQSAFVLAYTFMVASILTVVAVHYWMPKDDGGDGDKRTLTVTAEGSGGEEDGYNDEGVL